MKKLALLFAIMALSIHGFSQSKKLSKSKTQDVTVYSTDIIDGKETKYKDSFEKFNKLGKTIEKIEYTKEGEIKEKYTAIFEGENIVEETEENPEKKFFVKKVYKYNAMDDKSEEMIYDISNKLKKRHVYSYDKHGLKLEMKEYDPNNKLIQTKQFNYTKK